MTLSKKLLMQDQQREIIFLSAVGQPGSPGTLQWSGDNNHEAPPGCPGRRGQNASVPSPGTDGHDLRVRLSYAQDHPGLVQLSGEGPLIGNRWEISRDQVALLDCQGGAGGDGGKGENGQRGGQGGHGKDATRYSDATCGGPGLSGGDGGRGTNGADGGNAGSVYITVGEDDLDTLVAIEWTITGGRGGASGVHGDPGAGGRGGLGGAPNSWTETHSHAMTDSHGYSHTQYYTTHHTRPGAPPGPDGPFGMRPSEPLYGGRAGRDGISQIRVLRNDLTEGVYPSRYQLVVKDFDVVDENMDGINEPGEYLLVHNIQIQNVGGMPSPKGNVLKILIQPTPWLEPVVSEPLELPREIPPGATVKVPGVLSALIKNESSIRAPGTTFYAQDTVALTAYSPRLQRPLPEFFGGVKVTYQYPLIMSIPKHLDCVAKGDVVRFSWMIRNVSNKAYGGESALCRPACTHMSDPCGVFDLKYADKGLPHEVSDQIDTIDPGSEIPVIEDFQVSQLVPVFTTGFIDISLLLSDPHSGALRPITIFRLSIQISSSYFYNPLAQFLLVINGSTPNAAILQTMDFINNGLHLPVDIFNLSLVGSFRNPETEHNVLWNYVSKSVIIFGNPMNYFQAGFRNVWELFDPWEAYMLAKRNTSFLFVCPADINGLKGWVSQMMVPAFVFQPAPEWSIEKPSEIVKRLGLAQGERSDGILTLPVKKGTFHSLESRIKARSSSITKRLNHRLPTRRFLVGPCEPGSVEETKPSSGEIAIIEGLPHCAKIAVSLQQHADGFTSLTEYNIALIVHTIPFEEQCAIFWNLLGYDHTLGISAKLAYRGDALSHLNAKTVNADFEKDSILNGKACEALSWSIVTQLSSELSRFCYDSPWPDSTSKSKIVAQLPLLNNFVSSAPTSLTLASSLGASTLSTVLGPILAAQSPLNFGQWLSQSAIRFGNRKTKVRSVLQRQVKTLTEVICAPEWRTELQNALRTSTSTTKKALARTKGAEPGLSRVQRMHKLNCQALKDLTQTPNAQFFDLDALVGVHRAVDCSVEELREMRRLHEEGVQRIERDMLWSQQMLKDIVNPEGKV